GLSRSCGLTYGSDVTRRDGMSSKSQESFGKRLMKNVIREYDLYLLILPVLLYFIIFEYIPMIGVQLAFKEFSPIHGIFGDQWVGLKYFERFINSYDFWRIISNTVWISLYSLAIGFPAPIILALMLNEV